MWLCWKMISSLNIEAGLLTVPLVVHYWSTVVPFWSDHCVESHSRTLENLRSFCCGDFCKHNHSLRVWKLDSRISKLQRIVHKSAVSPGGLEKVGLDLQQLERSVLSLTVFQEVQVLSWRMEVHVWTLEPGLFRPHRPPLESSSSGGLEVNREVGQRVQSTPTCSLERESTKKETRHWLTSHSRTSSPSAAEAAAASLVPSLPT